MYDPNVIYGGDLKGSQELNYSSLGEMIIENLKKNGDKKNFINGITNEAKSYTEILEDSLTTSNALLNYGITENDVIGIILESRHDFISIAFGVFCVNAVLAPINFNYTERELKHALDLSKPKVVFTSALAVKNVIAVCKKLSYVKNVILLDEDELNFNGYLISFKDFIEKNSKKSFDIHGYVQRKVNTENKTALIFLSSGTTGMPKGVEITQRNIMGTLQYSRDRQPDYKRNYDNITTLAVAPWFHVLGFMQALISLLTGDSTYVFLAKFEPELYLRSIEKYRISILSTAPPIVVFLAKTPLFHKFDLSSLKAIFCGAAPLSRETELELKKRFKTKISIVQGYGMSETTFGIVGNVQESKPGSIGYVLNGSYAKVIDENGNSLGPYKQGELCFKGIRIMKGYLNNSTATSETIDKDGWLHTGDLGYYDGDKQFFIVDRLKELIKYKAYQVAPAEIEGILLSNPKIKDAGVIGIPNELAGELPLAFVVKQPNENLTEQEVKDFVAERVASTKWLHGGVKFIEEIPKNPSGKILRRELKVLYKNTQSKL